MRRIFLSYGHDQYAGFAGMLKQRLEGCGHRVWFDVERLHPGADWEHYIDQGLDWTAEPGANGCVVLLMTPHSIRRPDGFCLNELARAITKRIPIIPVSLAPCQPPLSVARIQRLDMVGCAEETPTKPFEPLFERLLDALANNNFDFQGSEATLLKHLTPPDFSVDISDRLQAFIGRDWAFKRVREWLEDPNGSRLLLIAGPPGVGKSALSVQIAQRVQHVAAFHACVHGNTQKADPRRVVMSIAYQLATQLPDLMQRLVQLDLERICSESNAQTLFDTLLVQPFASPFPPPGRPLVVVIDALDEAMRDGANGLASLLASEFTKAPTWLRMIMTSRPEEDVVLPLQRFRPYLLDAASAENLADLRVFLRARLREFSDTAVSTGTIDTIVDRSEGIFLYAVWVIDSLRDGTLSLDQVNSFPSGLGGVYLDFFQRRFGTPSGYGASEAYVHEYRAILELVVSAVGSLPVEYLANLMGWDRYRTDDMLAGLGSLFPQVAGAIRPFHLSIKEWVQERHKAGVFRVDALQGHRRHAGWALERWRTGTLTDWPYAVVNLPHHLEHSRLEGWQRTLRDVLLDYGWMKAKLDISDSANALLPDYSRLSADEDCIRAGAAIRQAARVLDRQPDLLPQQLFARIPRRESSELLALMKKSLASTRSDVPIPVTPSLAASGTLLRVLRGHEHFAVTRVAITADGRTAVSSSHDDTLRVWDVRSGEVRQILRGHTDAINHFALSADGQVAVSASDDRTVRVWHLETGRGRVLAGHEEAVRHVALSVDAGTAVTASWDKTLRVWDLGSATVRHVLRGHDDLVDYVALSANGEVAVSASSDKTVRVWDVATGQMRHVLRGHAERVGFVTLSPDGRTATSASVDNTLRVWDVVTGEESQVLRHPAERHWHLAVSVSGDGRTAVRVSHSEAETLWVWDLASGQTRHVLHGHEAFIESVAVSGDGGIAVSASSDKTLRVWDLKSGQMRQVLRGHTDRLLDVAVTEDGRVAVSAAHDKTLRVWDLTREEAPHGCEGHDDIVMHVALSNSQQVAVSGSWDTTIRVWDLESADVRHVLRGHEGAVLNVAVNREGRTAVSASADNTLRVWDLETGHTIRVLRGHDRMVTKVLLSPDGRTAVSASDKTLRLWDFTTDEPSHVLCGHEADVWDFAMSSDGRVLISVSAGGYHSGLQICVWDLPARCLRSILRDTLRTRPYPEPSYNSIALSADGRIATAALQDEAVHVWDLTAEKKVKILRGHEGQIAHLAVDPLGRFAVSASEDRTVRVWELPAGTPRWILRGHEDTVRQLAVTPNSQVAVSVSFDGTLRVWDLVGGHCTGLFMADEPLVTCDISPDCSLMVAGDNVGNVHLLRRAGDPWFLVSCNRNK